ncbi:ROK family protein [Chelatococcus sambhunathii]|uniref:ROK family protein n=1 Tax=Chelatococcus sambhunathii TaxID=363953 RepID=A0ABU1DCP4_9HYPH|nr:glucokinase [Chelatococcus sambhunathii]MDR4305690.1 ROK family protein [Chelatococcus sambhunathii]
MAGTRLLVGDIGGTHGRFALARADLRPERIGVEEGDAHPDFESALAAYLGKYDVKADTAAFAVAGPVTAGETARVTNRRNWAFDVESLKRRFGLSRVIVMNDFVAQAAALPHLTVDEIAPIGPAPRQIGGMKVAVGPGTGLGVAALAPEGPGWRPLPGEGGHVELAAVTGREWAAFELIRAELGRVEAEAVISGPGLLRLHRALAQLDGREAKEADAAAIVLAARRGETRALETVGLFLDMLARFCGDLALTYAAEGGVYVCGGVAPKMLDLIDPDAFRAAFEAKAPHEALMRRMATTVVVSPVAGLLGCAAQARRLLAGE